MLLLQRLNANHVFKGMATKRDLKLIGYEDVIGDNAESLTKGSPHMPSQ